MNEARIAALATLLWILPGQAVAAPKLVFEEREHDWGLIEQGKVATHTFRIANSGSDPLTILDVESSCECTVPKVSKNEIAPGGKAQIDVTFDSKRFTGSVTKELTVRSNDPDEPEAILRLYANIKPGILTDPAMVDLGMIPRGGGRTATLRITAADATPFKVLGAVTGLPFLSARVVTPEGGGAAASTSFTLEVTAARGGQPGPFTDFLQIATTHPRTDTLQVTVKGEVESLFQLTPERLAFGSQRAKKQKLGEVKIVYRGEGSVKFTGASSSTPALQAELKPASGGREATVEVFLTSEARNGRLSGTITITTDASAQPSIPVRVVGTIQG